MGAFEKFIAIASSLPIEERELLDGDLVIAPPRAESGYDTTPRNSLTFADMGVDGVHTVILNAGANEEDRPVLQVSPTDFESPLTVLAPDFVTYLADGCGVAQAEVLRLLEDSNALTSFLRVKFERSVLLEEARCARLNRLFLARAEEAPQAASTGWPPNQQ